ncbi:MAG: transposase [Dongiaceae bacterium]
MDEDSRLPFDLRAVRRNKVTLAFDGGRLSAEGGVLLLREFKRNLVIAERLAARLPERRDRAHRSRAGRDAVAAHATLVNRSG